MRNTHDWVVTLRRDGLLPCLAVKTDIEIVYDITKIPVSTIYKYVNDDPLKYKKKVWTPIPKTTKKGHSRKFTPDMVKELTDCVIKTVDRGVQPRAHDVLEEMRKKFPSLVIGVRQFQRILKNNSFTYRKTVFDRNEATTKPYNQAWKMQYLLTKRQLEAEGRKFYFTDETWFHATDCDSKSYQPKKGISTRKPKAPRSKGKRFIILHIGSQDGFVDGAEEIFHDRDDYEGDYHKYMTSQFYEKWLKNLVINGKIPRKSVIVMDNASYHKRQTHCNPSMSMTKKTLINFVRDHDRFQNADSLRNFRKKDIMAIIKEMNIQPEYATDKILEEYDIRILRLPPYHCQFNPIEKAWSGMKRKVRRKNIIDWSVEVVREKIKQALIEENEHWDAYVRHCKKIENQEYENTLQNRMENFM